MSGNAELIEARLGKNDEFYTQMEDIELEMAHYRGLFEGKEVYCNCDDPDASNFFRYFVREFDRLGLKRATATCYRNQEEDLFGAAPVPAAGAVFDGGEIERFELCGDGDFRSEECAAFLDRADVVVTNPPFSLFRDFIALMIDCGKAFNVLGNMNASTSKSIFPLFQSGRIRYGPSIGSGDRWFEVPAEYPLDAATAREDDESGRRFVKVKGVRWFTNMDHGTRREPLALHRSYDPGAFPSYVGHEAIEVPSVGDIPADYPGVMGVPITFLDKFDPGQFEIVGMGPSTLAVPCADGGRRGVYARILVRNRNPLKPD